MMKIVCLIGSTRFGADFDYEMMRQTTLGNIVLTIGSHRVDDDTFFLQGRYRKKEELRLKHRMEALHRAKIRSADEIIVINRGGYVGLSTCDEIAYAVALGKKINAVYQPCDAIYALRRLEAE